MSLNILNNIRIAKLNNNNMKIIILIASVIDDAIFYSIKISPNKRNTISIDVNTIRVVSKQSVFFLLQQQQIHIPMFYYLLYLITFYLLN